MVGDFPPKTRQLDSREQFWAFYLKLVFLWSWGHTVMSSMENSMFRNVVGPLASFYSIELLYYHILALWKKGTST